MIVLTYKKLENVQNGVQAMNTFASMKKMKKKK